MAACSKIPPELTDCIIDYLHADDHALATCSLVCRSWVPASRYHLFNAISLHPWKKDSFLRLLDSPVITFTPYVRHLFIREGRGAYTWENKWLNTALPRLTVLRSVDSLEVERVTWEFLGTKAKRSFLTNFQSITKLKLRQFEFRSSWDLIYFASSFTMLQDLRLEDVRWDRDNGTPPSQQVGPFHLEVLGMYACSKPSVVEWVLCTKPGAPIHTVRFGMLTAHDTPRVAQMLKVLGPSLKNLHLHFDADYYHNGMQLIQMFDLARNNELRSVHIYRLIIQESAPTDWILHFFRGISSNHIQEVSIALWFADSIRDVEALDWEALAAVFARPNFAGLHKARFVVVGKDASLAAVRIQEYLPALHEKGILTVDMGIDDRKLV